MLRLNARTLAIATVPLATVYALKDLKELLVNEPLARTNAVDVVLASRSMILENLRVLIICILARGGMVSGPCTRTGIKILFPHVTAILVSLARTVVFKCVQRVTTHSHLTRSQEKLLWRLAQIIEMH